MALDLAQVLLVSLVNRAQLNFHKVVLDRLGRWRSIFLFFCGLYAGKDHPRVSIFKCYELNLIPDIAVLVAHQQALV